MPASPTNPVQIMDPVYHQNSLMVRTNQTADPRLFVSLSAALGGFCDQHATDWICARDGADERLYPGIETGGAFQIESISMELSQICADLL